jgi:tetrahydromethanopterin S-methyltransferase subunit D
MVHETISTELATAIALVKTGVLLLGSAITYFAYKAYRSQGRRSLRLLTVGFTFIVLGGVLGGITDLLLPVSIASGILLDSLLTLVGFAVITYSLYTR